MVEIIMTAALLTRRQTKYRLCSMCLKLGLRERESTRWLDWEHLVWDRF